MIEGKIWVIKWVSISKNSRVGSAKFGGKIRVGSLGVRFAKTLEASGRIINYAQPSGAKAKAKIYVGKLTERRIEAVELLVNGFFYHEAATRNGRIFPDQSAMIVISIGGRLTIKDIANRILHAKNKTGMFDTPVVLEDLTGNTANVIAFESTDELNEGALRNGG